MVWALFGGIFFWRARIGWWHSENPVLALFVGFCLSCWGARGCGRQWVQVAVGLEILPQQKFEIVAIKQSSQSINQPHQLSTQ